MIAINMSMVGAAAVIASGFVAADNVTSRYFELRSTPSPDGAFDDTTVDFNALNQRARAAVAMLSERRQANAVAASGAPTPCREQAWPYYSAECLAVAGNASVHGAVRVVGVERHAQPAARHPISRDTLAAGWSQCLAPAWPYQSAPCIAEANVVAAAQAAPAMAPSAFAASSQKPIRLALAER